MKLNDIREAYLKFFEAKNHLRVKSASLVPPNNDKSLLIINSGMAPLKPYFVGTQTPPSDRLTSCQKCIRTGDIENVGVTSRHGTFFEMLGNFSFNDYFKNEAIEWAWEFATKVMKLDEEKIYISVYLEDDETEKIWHEKIGVPMERITRLGKDDNFWEVGLGPCGPCSELHYDRGIEFGCGKDTCAVGCDCDRFLEFWNLVFTQFNKEEDGSYSNLGRVNIDTGMGLERMAVILQGVESLFDVDTVAALRNKICDIAGVTYKKDHKTDVSIRKITDHVRSITFMTADGILPSNEGRGYVLRRLARVALRHGRLLGIKGEFLPELVDMVIQSSGQAYPELVEKKEYIFKVISSEEASFNKTLDQGLELLNKIIKNTKSVVSGEEAFKMYDTYGFPLELMEEIVAEHGLSIDTESYKTQMEAQRTRARNARGDSTFLGTEDSVLNQLDRSIKTEFVGYTQLEATSEILFLIKENALVEEVSAGDQVSVIVSKTPFYAESGGQKGDIGRLTTATGEIEINDTKKVNDKFVHIGQVVSGTVRKSQVDLVVDETNRTHVIRNHTAAHLLHTALKKVLGSHVEQAGSEVSSQKTRFDFSHMSQVTPDELEQIEAMVNEQILAARPVTISNKTIDEAKAEGAIALFGEKYGDIVRVVNIEGFSIELCGGTHVDNTAKIGLFKIISEGAAASGVRRIEVITGARAIQYVKDKEALIKHLAVEMKATEDNMLDKAHALVAQNKELKSKVESLTQKLNSGALDDLQDKNEVINGKNLFVARIDNVDQNGLRTFSDQIKDKLKSAIIVLTGAVDGKVAIVVSVTEDLIGAGFKAGDIAKDIAAQTGGKGGGRPNMAMAGGTDVSAIDAALEATKANIKAKL